MKKYKILLIIFGISYIWLGDAYSHKGETHKKHTDESSETVVESKGNNIEQKTVTVPSIVHEEHKHPKTIEIGSFNIIQISKKAGYNVAVIFTGFIAVIWGIVSFYWRNGR
ncbi:MAG: hypothetical protein HY096_12960 [Nitrospinae bacterium]|nr:hypothetical protein [Nitrospinota bacterium]